MKPGLSLKIIIVLLLLLLSVIGHSGKPAAYVPATVGAPTDVAPSTGPIEWPYGSGAGTWTPPASSRTGPLHAIAAVGPDDAWAVGESTDSPHHALAIHWDGKSWNNVFTFDTGLGDNKLQAVAAIKHDDVWAVGSVQAQGYERMLIAHWDGTKWELTPLPAMDLTWSELNAIDAIGSDDIWAAGASQVAPSLVIHWNGRSWTLFPASPNPPPRLPPALHAIDVVNGNDIWTVGDGMILHWDGTSWMQTYKGEEETTRLGPTSFTDIRAISKNDVWAIGNFNLPTNCNIAVGYIMHWDGSVWTEAYSMGGQAPCGITLALNGIFATSSDSIWVVGQSGLTPLLMHWDGHKWSTDPCPGGVTWSPYAGFEGDRGQLNGIAQLSKDELWAVGTYFRTVGTQFDQTGYALDTRHGACPVLPTPTPRPTFTPAPPPPTLPPAPPPQLTSYAPVSTGEPQVPIAVYTALPQP